MINTLIALTALSSGSAAGQDVAFVARYYYPYPDKRISTHQVYVSEIDGRNRQQLTTGTPAPEQLAWVGEHMLCWIENIGHKKDQLVLYNLRTKTRRVLVSSRNTLQLVGQSDLYRKSQLPEYDDGVTRYRINEFGANFIGKSKEIKWTRGVESPSWQLPGEPLIRFVGYEVDDIANRAQFPYNDFLYTFERESRRYEWRLEGAANQFYPGSKPGTAYLHSIDGGASAGTWECFYEVNWGSGDIRCLISDVYMISLRKGEDHWSGLESGRTLSPYGHEKNVWTCEAYVGNLSTGKQWAIASGLVECYEIALR